MSSASPPHRVSWSPQEYLADYYPSSGQIRDQETIRFISQALRAPERARRYSSFRMWTNTPPRVSLLPPYASRSIWPTTCRGTWMKSAHGSNSVPRTMIGARSFATPCRYEGVAEPDYDNVSSGGNGEAEGHPPLQADAGDFDPLGYDGQEFLPSCRGLLLHINSATDNKDTWHLTYPDISSMITEEGYSSPRHYASQLLQSRRTILPERRSRRKGTCEPS